MCIRDSYDLYHTLYGQNRDILFATETWLRSDFPDSLLDPESKYNILRCDRTATRGVCLFVSKNLKYSHVTRFCDAGFEATAVDVFLVLLDVGL